jgi:8-amino-7-oxononanoate synthase
VLPAAALAHTVTEPFDFTPELKRLRAEHLYRSRLTVEGPLGAEVTVGGRRYLAFCSNDYLGLANHPQVRQAFKRAADRYGVGSGASHLIIGHGRAHHALEEELAEFTGRPRALLFSTGYMANLGVIGALVGRGDVVVEDRLNHASLIDGARLCGARLKRYGHGDCRAMEERLGRMAGSKALAASDGVFSMEGDLAPLPSLAQAASRHGAWLVIDDAHGLGVLGRSGGGTLEHFGLGVQQVPVLVGTLGKAFGTFGAFVAGAADLVELLIQRARSYIYTTALPPAVAEATRASLRIVRSESWRREHLASLVQRFRSAAAELGLPLKVSPTPIQPVLAPDAPTAVRWSEELREAGILVQAIRPPTVPSGGRLRVALSAAHTEAQVDRLVEALGRLR